MSIQKGILLCIEQKDEKTLSKKLSEIFDKKLPFIETEDKDNCKFCAYKNLCGN